jgi:hypothetical protein
MFMANYKNLWTDGLPTDQIRQANDVIWYEKLNGFPVEIMEAAALDAMEQCKFPPSIQEFREIVRARYKRLMDKKTYKQNEAKLISIDEWKEQPLSREALEAKRKIFQALGLTKLQAKIDAQLSTQL